MFSSSSLWSTQKDSNGSSAQLKLNPIPDGTSSRGPLNNEPGKMLSKPSPRQDSTGQARGPGPHLPSPLVQMSFHMFWHFILVWPERFTPIDNQIARVYAFLFLGFDQMWPIIDPYVRLVSCNDLYFAFGIFMRIY